MFCFAIMSKWQTKASKFYSKIYYYEYIHTKKIKIKPSPNWHVEDTIIILHALKSRMLMYYLQAGRPIMYRWISTESECSTFEKFQWNQIHPSLVFASAWDVQPGFQTQLRFRQERSVSIFCGEIIHRVWRVSAYNSYFFKFYFPPSCDWQLPPPLGLRWRLWIFALCHSTTSRSFSTCAANP